VNSSDQGRRVWDLPTRITHWALVLAVSGSWITSKLGSSYFPYHVYCGYTVLILVVFRILWGFVGTRHARFAHFVCGPVRVMRYLRYLREHAIGAPAHHSVGHNPLGGWSVLLLLGLLLAQAGTGLFANDEIDNTGPFFGWVTEHGSNLLSGYHRRLFALIEIAVALHLVAVVYYTAVRRDSLIRPMFTGRKSAAQVPASEEIIGSRLGLAGLIVLLLVAALALAVHLAPEATLSVF